jgi:hypothetical protein
MHENRENSSTPWSDDQGRSAKAMNRTADMHALEKSDCAVIPMKQPNKGGQPSAEAVEGRAQTEENIVEPHMHPTQSGKRMSQGLDGVRTAARERKQERFTALLHHLSIDLLRESFYALQRRASPGVDARDRRQRGEGKPETFTFLGFTHFCGQRISDGAFIVWRITAKKRMVAKLKAIKAELQRRKHDRTATVGAWLRTVVLGYYQYHAVPGNTTQLRIFQQRVNRMWRSILIRRSQRAQVRWERLTPLLSRWVPQPRVLHPYPDARFYATHPS